MDCERCRQNHGGSYGSGRFCSSKCARGFSTSKRRDEISLKVSKALRGAYLKDSKCKWCGTTFKGRRTKYCGPRCKHEARVECGRKGGKTSHKGLHQLAPPSILSLSPRTTSKVLKRLGIGCSNCGWDKASCDIHHMEGRENPLRDRHENLVHLCPNCHRLAHRGALEKTELVSLAAQVGEDWRKHYFG